VEDEQDICNLMQLHLSREGYQTRFVSTGKQAYHQLTSHPFQLIILDWMIPEISGLELLKWMRQTSRHHQRTPVLFVTAKFRAENIVLALETGADDYITKPFDFTVFIARVKNLIKRMRILEERLGDHQKVSLQFKDLVLDTEAHRIFIQGKEISLTRSEFCLLEILLRNQGKALSRKQMVSFIQGENISVTGRTVDTHISILRKKIGPYGQFIETVRGVGYRIGFIS